MGSAPPFTAHRRLAAAVSALAVCLTFTKCGGAETPGYPPTNPSPTVPGPPTIPNPPPTSPPFTGPQIFSGAGDIARCQEGQPAAVSRLLDTIGGLVFTLGDNAYMNGTAREFRECYDPTWGRHKIRTRPTPGNHEYGSPGAAPYFEYFGAEAAGPFGLGYYSFDLPPWHIISLNSEIPTSPGSPQGMWLQEDLEQNAWAKCTLAYWHKPLYSSGPNGDHPHMRAIWTMLYDAGAEIVLAGHDHLYERFGPQDPSGRPDERFGIRQFIVGTGGVPLYDFLRVTKPNSQRQIKAHGVLKLTLFADRYEWDFVPLSGLAGDRDSGADVCH